MNNYAEFITSVDKEFTAMLRINHYLNDAGKERLAASRELLWLSDFANSANELISLAESNPILGDASEEGNAEAVSLLAALRRIAGFELNADRKG